MNRLGKVILLLIVLAAAAFATIVRFSPAPTPQAPPVAALKPVVPADTGATITPSGLAIPVAGIVADKLADSFGDARGGGARGHGALDIMAPRGTPVLAAAAGTVEKLFDSANGGHTIYVRSADERFVYYYAHLDTYAADLREGLSVERGQAIATVGSTGDASPDGPHLHFEIKRMAPGETWYEGTAINPYPLLAGGAARR